MGSHDKPLENFLEFTSNFHGQGLTLVQKQIMLKTEYKMRVKDINQHPLVSLEIVTEDQNTELLFKEYITLDIWENCKISYLEFCNLSYPDYLNIRKVVDMINVMREKAKEKAENSEEV